jgi:hypothetical protein
MCQEMAVKGEIVCPFTLTGIAKIEKRMGKAVYQPVAHACEFPMHPSCATRSGEVGVQCHKSRCKTFQALVAHASARGKVDEEEDDIDGELHQHLRHWLASVHPMRA